MRIVVHHMDEYKKGGTGGRMAAWLAYWMDGRPGVSNPVLGAMGDGIRERGILGGFDHVG